MRKKIFILGTQSLTSSEDSTLRFGCDNTIVIPFPECIDALEKLSAEFTEKGRIARKMLEYFSSFTTHALLSKGGVRQKNGSILRYENEYQDIAIPKGSGNLSPLDKHIIQIALGLKKNSNLPVIIVSKKPGFRIKAQAIGLQAQDFKDDIFPALKDQYTGRIDCEASVEKINNLYKNGFIMTKDIQKNTEIEWCQNLFLNITSLTGNSSALARYDGNKIVPLQFIDTHPYGITALKAGQHMALEALMQTPEVAPIVIIKGGAGTGKTFISLAVALDKTTSSNKIYHQVLVSTPTETIREENLGFLPGELEEKFDPYLGGVMDNLSLLLTNKKKKDGKTQNSEKKVQARTLLENGTVVLQLIGHLRGRSWKSQYKIDEKLQS